MLGLKLPTDPRWVNLAEKSIEEILTDHAYCEQKATSTNISLIQNYPEYEEMVDAVTPVVSEEWGHFKMVLEQLKKRGMKLGPQRKDIYVNELMKFVRKGGSRKESLTDKLLLSAMIEARSCERFKLLSKEVNDAELRDFYKRLMVSEAGHYKLFLDLATSVMGEDFVTRRWQEWLDYEAGVMERIDLRGDRMH
ncbi:MAG: tRNA-(ms[2]io[6]A)-hydroxylase [Bacteroidetes bacterium]|nr:tRNA-(ms[2]io[6]A)-hydroxylase [Bacteroidota bacterium]MBS1685692.1 tRNA-(ms[2]io[6]A)-hydroxylase [Bacteroidota bacterium]